MSKLATLKAAYEAAEAARKAAPADMALFDTADAASQALNDYEWEVRQLKARFEAMNCAIEDSCIQNAQDAGYNEGDLDFWKSCIWDAENN